MAKALTRKDDLRTRTPYWATTPRIGVVTSLKPKARRYDVVIVGGGISGALMADALADGKRRILLLDRRRPVTGSTLASTALIQHDIDVPLHALAQMIGKAKAVRAWQRSATAVDALVARSKALEIACQMEARRALYLAGDAYGSRALMREVEMRKEAGLDARYLDAGELRASYGIDRTAAIASSPAAAANPAQLAAGLLHSARRRGLEIVASTAVTDLRSTRDAAFLATSHGCLIEAGHAVFCTGYEFLEPLARQDHDIVSTWAIATRPLRNLPAWLDRHVVWEASDTYLYFRTTHDRRLIAGGEDEADPDAHESPSKLKTKSRRIAAKVARLLRIDIGPPEFQWAAAFGATPTGLPLIGRVPGLAHVHAVMGFGGNGFTFSMIAAEIVAADIAGKPDPDADLFAFS